MPPDKFPPNSSEESEPNKGKKPINELVQGLSQLSQIGITILACILIGVFAGRFLDSVFNSSPWLLLVFSLLGAGAAFKYLYDLTKKI